MGEQKEIPHITESQKRRAHYEAEMALLALQRMRGELVKASSTTTITPEMVHEAFAHLPFEVSRQSNQARWEWLADYLNKAVGNPDTPCSCCGVTPNGDIPGDEPGQASTAAPKTAQVAAWCVPEVLAEIERATRKFPTWPTDPLHALAVLGEEFGELTKAVLQTAYEPHKVKWDELRSEAVQTAAMALRFLTSLDRYEFRRCEQHVQQRLAWEVAMESGKFTFHVRADHTTIDYTATRNSNSDRWPGVRWTVTWISPSTGQQERLRYTDEIVRDWLSNGRWQLIDPPVGQAEQQATP